MLGRAKAAGFADRYRARLFGVAEAEVRQPRLRLGKAAAYDAVSVSSVENAACGYSTGQPRPDEVPSRRAAR